MRIHETLGEDLQDMGEDSWERIHETLGEDSRLWERICEDSQDFGRGFMRL